MQLDNTRITVRERSLPEILDLALHVIREYFQPWLATTLLAALPLALVNYGLVGWMADVDYDEGDFPLRFLWNMTLLVYIEAPLASIFTVAYLGPAVFLERRSIREVVRDVFVHFPKLVLNQLLLRGILVAWLLAWMVNFWYRLEIFTVIEGLLLPLVAGYTTLFRGLRPYMNELVLLEKLPLRARHASETTLGKRSAYLHGPHSADLLGRWILGAMVSVLLWFSLCYSTQLLYKLLFHSGDLTWQDLILRYQITWFEAQILYPALLWLLAAYFSVVRFLDYLNLRIKHEGWEVELLMRAEALRLAGKSW
jgi:hypothetical protein